ncbi:uncharacterized protein LOC126424661 [Schistocerca serialis cubense]|uniref:uncharacterized protein LOC126424661 n=1 Tax=Schistocerca serialis cubense TaxID=2023355 RepID=UPI00214F2830|nr:uncharacterized protein LOC126424661 [Schistocerca serialis cubense]
MLNESLEVAFFDTMESTEEEVMHMLSGEIDIKEEAILTDSYWRPLEEFEQIDIKQDNVEWETPDGFDVCDPLHVQKEEWGIFEDLDACDSLQLKEEQLEIPEDIDACDLLKVTKEASEVSFIVFPSMSSRFNSH